MMNHQKEFLQRLNSALKREKGYKEEAYFFILAALNRALGLLKTPRHISGKELLDGIRQEARHQFGPMAGTVFEFWGIKNSLDFGRIVFNMVHVGLLSKTEADTLEDFEDKEFFSHLFNESEAYSLSEVSGAATKSTKKIKLKKQSSKN